MERIEYRDVIDKAEWARGEWSGEPDKIQWMDEGTGLPCLIVRGPVGALCGYVGVPEGHPFHGLGYSSCRHGACPDKRDYCDHTPESILRAHGGVTFAGGCSDTRRERWEEWRRGRKAWEAEARTYPKGDAARRLKEWAGCFDNYEAWAERAHRRFICHIPGAGEPDHVWWFGFDCAHCDDHCPSMDRAVDRGVYRNIAYVEAECRELAKQLKSLAAAN